VERFLNRQSNCHQMPFVMPLATFTCDSRNWTGVHHRLNHQATVTPCSFKLRRIQKINWEMLDTHTPNMLKLNEKENQKTRNDTR